MSQDEIKAKYEALSGEESAWEFKLKNSRNAAGELVVTENELQLTQAMLLSTRQRIRAIQAFCAALKHPNRHDTTMPNFSLIDRTICPDCGGKVN